jgi:hypothetical protein
MLPSEKFHQMLQDTLRSSALESVSFYNQQKVVALLDRLPSMSETDLITWDPILMSVLSACIIQKRFALAGPVEEPSVTELMTERATEALQLPRLPQDTSRIHSREGERPASPI